MSVDVNGLVLKGVEIAFAQLGSLEENFNYERKMDNVYDPSTGVASSSTVSKMAKGIIFDIKESDGRYVTSYRIDGDAVRVGDKKILMKSSNLGNFELGIDIVITRLSDSSKWKVINYNSDVTGSLTNIQIRRTV